MLEEPSPCLGGNLQSRDTLSSIICAVCSAKRVDVCAVEQCLGVQVTAAAQRHLASYTLKLRTALSLSGNRCVSGILKIVQCFPLKQLKGPALARFTT
jgi:hypothetical protein